MLFVLFCLVQSVNCLTRDFNLTPKQAKYKSLLEDANMDMILAHGSAGTGKTVLACSDAIRQLKEGSIRRIILTRPVVTVEDEDIGFLPGTMNEKMNPFLLPIMDYFKEDLSQQKLESLIRCGVIEIAPFGFMRGRTFDNCYIIADEMQNSTPQQMKMMLTRIGMNSRIVITGDKTQSDLHKSQSNGLEDLLLNLDKYYGNEEWKMYQDGISTIELEDIDIKRSRICKTILRIYTN